MDTRRQWLDLLDSALVSPEIVGEWSHGNEEAVVAPEEARHCALVQRLEGLAPDQVQAHAQLLLTQPRVHSDNTKAI